MAKRFHHRDPNTVTDLSALTYPYARARNYKDLR
jgi:hypothetical protein